ITDGNAAEAELGPVIMQARSTMLLVLGKLGFHEAYGADQGGDIENVISRLPHPERFALKQIRRQIEVADPRELFLDAVDSVRLGLLATSKRPADEGLKRLHALCIELPETTATDWTKAAFLASSLAECMDKVRDADSCGLRLPILVTNIVSVAL